MGRDDHPKERHQRALERRQNARAAYERVLIVTEGSKTEPLYFQGIRSFHKLNGTNVQIYPSDAGTSPLHVVEYAERLLTEGSPKHHRNVRARHFERVYAVFDRDEHPSFADAVAKARALNGKYKNDAKQTISFSAAASSPCFELWLLLHFEDVHHAIDRHEAHRRLKRLLPGYEKSAVDVFAKTRELTEVAITRARKMNERSGGVNPPFTGVFEIVELLLGMGRSRS